MSLLDTIADKVLSRTGDAGFIVNSMPKAGTNLLAKAFTLLPGFRPTKIHFGQDTAQRFQRADEVSIPIGIDWPQPVSLSAVRQSLQKLNKGCFATGHIPYSDELADAFRQSGIRSVLMMRDPRDVVVSHARYVAKTSSHFLHGLYREMSEFDRIKTSIIGIRSGQQGPVLMNIAERFQSIMPWNSWPFNCTTYFECLVGPKGGGAQNLQIAELERVVEHVGLHCKAKVLATAAEQLFGGTKTFHQGLIGSWRTCFAAEHKYLFKEVAGTLLIDLGYTKDNDW